MNKKRPAVFFDRDGTLMEDVGTVSDPADISLFDDTAAALKLLQQRYELFIVTNQAGISKGEVSMRQVEKINERLAEMLHEKGVIIRESFICPHSTEDRCQCRKPEPGMILTAAAKYDIDLTRSFIIGDHPHDAATGNRLGVYGLYVLTGHGQKHLSELPFGKLIFHRLRDAANWILSHPEHEADISKQLAAGGALIRNGGVVAFPTETVYGLGANVFNEESVSRIFKIKGRPKNNPLIAHISDVDQLKLLSNKIPENASRLIDEFWPGPLTIILKKADAVPDIVTAGNSTVAVRMPANAIALELINISGTPIAAPSANIFTFTSPTTAQHVKDQLGGRCELIIDGGACRVGVESTVISFTGQVPIILRPGGVSKTEIEEVTGKVKTSDSVKNTGAESPGQMLNHYAPKTRLKIVSRISEEIAKRPDVGIILLKPAVRNFCGHLECLSKQGDLNDAAVNFYAALRRLDSKGLKMIVACPFPGEGIGTALNDRLRKAAGGQHNCGKN